MTTRASATRTQSLGAADEHKRIAEVVETAIDSNDLLPLVRIALDGQFDTGSPFSVNSSLETIPEIVKNCLQKVIDEADTSAADHSRANATAIATALDELESIQKSTETLSLQFQSINIDIQTAVEALLVRWKEFSELQEMEKSLLTAGSNLEWACTLLQRCVSVSQYIDHHKLYQALNILDQLQEQMQEDGTTTSHVLQSFLQGIIVELHTIIQQIAVKDFNDWLVTARSEARQIGLQAIRQAAISRQHEDRCAQERKAVLEKIKSTHSWSEALSLISPTLGTREATAENSSRPAFQSMDVSVSGTPTPSHHDDDLTSVLSERSGVTGGLFQRSTGGMPLMESANKTGMTMRGLHRCIFVHKRLGRMRQFREYYLEQRRLQIDSDLRPPSNFLEVYQAYLAQVTGFFVVEDNVMRMADNLIQQQDVDAFWEMAIGMLKSVVDAAFEELNSAPAMLLVKDFLLLVCSGLSKSGYPAANLKEILSCNMGKYHALMNEQVSSQVNKIVSDDRMDSIKIKTTEMYEEYIRHLRLPDAIDERSEQLPFMAPFTEMVPQIIYIIHEYIRDSIAYLKGLINPGDVLTTACQHRDKMLKVLFDSMQTQIGSMSHVDLSLRDSMQLIANMWALNKGLCALDDWAVQHFCGNQPSSDQPGTITRRASITTSVPSSTTAAVGHWQRSDFLGGGSSVMRGVEESCIRLLVHIASQEINRFLSQIRSWDFVPRAPPTAATSPLVEELIIYLQGVYDMGKQQMPRSTADTVVQAVMHTVGSGFTDILCSNAVPSINEYGFARLLEDLTALEQFAGRFPVSGLSKEFTAPRQLCSLVVGGKGFGEDVTQILSYIPDVSIRTAITALEKFREIGGWQAPRNTRRVTRRRDIDLVVRKLKEQVS